MGLRKRARSPRRRRNMPEISIHGPHWDEVGLMSLKGAADKLIQAVSYGVVQLRTKLSRSCSVLGFGNAE